MHPLRHKPANPCRLYRRTASKKQESINSSPNQSINLFKEIPLKSGLPYVNFRPTSLNPLLPHAERKGYAAGFVKKVSEFNGRETTVRRLHESGYEERAVLGRAFKYNEKTTADCFGVGRLQND